jgi:hypothetical protein
MSAAFHVAWVCVSARFLSRIKAQQEYIKVNNIDPWVSGLQPFCAFDTALLACTHLKTSI